MILRLIPFAIRRGDGRMRIKIEIKMKIKN